MDKLWVVKDEAILQVIDILLKKGVSLDTDSKESRVHAERCTGDVLSRLVMTYNLQLNPHDFDALRKDIVESCFGYGPIQPLLNDTHITDIMVNGPKQVFVEKNGMVEKSNAEFANEDEIIKLLNRMLSEGGKHLDRNSPFVDIKIKDSARVTAVIPPISVGSTSFVIRKKMRGGFTFEDLVKLGTIDEKLLSFLKYCIAARLNILITGSTGAGKTTLLNLLMTELVPPTTRVLVMEDTDEISAGHNRHVLKLLTRAISPDGKGEVTLHDLVKLSLHLRPDRLIIGEIRGEEVFSLLQAVNTGHDGSMCTIHANSSRDAVARLEMLSLMARSNIEIGVIRRFIKSGIDLVIHMHRFAGGRRIVAQASELSMRGNDLDVDDIFDLDHSAKDGKEVFAIKPTGRVPHFMDRLKACSDIKDDFFHV